MAGNLYGDRCSTKLVIMPMMAIEVIRLIIITLYGAFIIYLAAVTCRFVNLMALNGFDKFTVVMRQV